jgi:uncharacterized membrane protein YeaQ/YmgE (transglycosylase-associated protein family)
MSFVIAMIMRFIVGAVAKLIVPWRDPRGIAITCLLGIFRSRPTA